MTDKKLTDGKKVMKEIGVLIDRCMLQIVNAMRHIDLTKSGDNAIRRVDQLTRALEYLCDVEEYNKIIEAKMRGLMRSNRKHKQLIREMRKSPNAELEGFDELFIVSTKQSEEST